MWSNLAGFGVIKFDLLYSGVIFETFLSGFTVCGLQRNRPT